MEKSLEFDFIFKYILIGDTSVGKSTILSMFINSQFQSESNPTMGVEFATKKMNVNGKLVKLQIWDTAGQESFRTITRAYYKNAIGIILVYDLTNPKSKQTIDSWLQEIHDNSNQQAEIFIVANKTDLANDPKNYVEKKGYTFYSTSARTGMNINKLFQNMTENILKKINDKIIDEENTFGIKKGNRNGALKLTGYGGDENDEDDKKKKLCC